MEAGDQSGGSGRGTSGSSGSGSSGEPELATGKWSGGGTGTGGRGTSGSSGTSGTGQKRQWHQWVRPIERQRHRWHRGPVAVVAAPVAPAGRGSDQARWAGDQWQRWEAAIGGSSGSGGGGDGSGSSREVVNKTPPKLSEEDRKSITKTIYIIVIALLLALLLATAVYYIRKWLKGRKRSRNPSKRSRHAVPRSREDNRMNSSVLPMPPCAWNWPGWVFRARPRTLPESICGSSPSAYRRWREAGDITQALVQVLYAGQVPEAGILTRLDTLLGPDPRQGQRPPARRSRRRVTGSE